jgi:transcriptional regulator with XRE-family HTH domain
MVRELTEEEMNPVEVSPAQSRAARALINLTQVRLAKLANLSQSMIRDFEKGRRMPTTDELEAIRSAFEARGVEFIVGGQPGVRLRTGRVIRATWDLPPPILDR